VFVGHGSDKELVEMIHRDIMDASPNIRWEDIAKLEDAKRLLQGCLCLFVLFCFVLFWFVCILFRFLFLCLLLLLYGCVCIKLGAIVVRMLI
jgi:hypothetical protein